MHFCTRSARAHFSCYGGLHIQPSGCTLVNIKCKRLLHCEFSAHKRLSEWLRAYHYSMLSRPLAHISCLVLFCSWLPWALHCFVHLAHWQCSCRIFALHHLTWKHVTLYWESIWQNSSTKKWGAFEQKLLLVKKGERRLILQTRNISCGHNLSDIRHFCGLCSWEWVHTLQMPSVKYRLVWYIHYIVSAVHGADHFFFCPLFIFFN